MKVIILQPIQLKNKLKENKLKEKRKLQMIYLCSKRKS